MPASGEIFGGNFVRAQGHGRAQVGAHGPLRVRRHQRKTTAIGNRASFESADIRAHSLEALLVKGGRGVVSNLAQKTGAETQALRAHD